MKTTFSHWLAGIRFYIAVAIGLVTIETVIWAVAVHGRSNLAAIRVEETFAWLSLALLGTALLVGPLYTVFPKLGARALMRDARRMLGIGAAWFATLHAGTAYIGQFQRANPLSLPTTYKWAFLWGGLALIMLLALAFTSFNAAMRRMGKHWFRLHRLAYAAALLALVHAFMIGVHAANLLPLTLLAVFAAIIVGLQLVASFTGHKPTRWQLATITSVYVLLVAVFTFGVVHKRQALVVSSAANAPVTTMQMSPAQMERMQP